MDKPRASPACTIAPFASLQNQARASPDAHAEYLLGHCCHTVECLKQLNNHNYDNLAKAARLWSSKVAAQGHHVGKPDVRLSNLTRQVREARIRDRWINHYFYYKWSIGLRAVLVAHFCDKRVDSDPDPAMAAFRMHDGNVVVHTRGCRHFRNRLSLFGQCHSRVVKRIPAIDVCLLAAPHAPEWTRDDEKKESKWQQEGKEQCRGCDMTVK